MYIEFAKLRIYPAAVIATSLIGTFFSPVYAADKPHPQEFIVTAYYSPLPDQCCYFRGSYSEDLAFNGEGKVGADGTAVYPGMVAAPPTYPFGTVIELPGIGVGTVHDRGSRVVEWGDDVHRIDLWMGYGEEGLSRALAWGVRSVRGAVYPPDAEGKPAERLSLEAFPADGSSLAQLPKTDELTLLTLAKAGDQSYAVRFLQTTLKRVGYFDDAATGMFGPATKSALGRFLAEYGLPGDGTAVEKRSAAALMAAVGLPEQSLPDVPQDLARGAQGSDVRQVQKLLRYLGYYRGRTDGIFDRDVQRAILSFQLEKGVVRQAMDSGAGRIGPATKAAILKAWKIRQASARSRTLLAKMQVTASIGKDVVPSRVLSKGDRGAPVTALQRLLRRNGYLKDGDITGLFGTRTERGIIAYQKEKKIVSSVHDRGAGVFGPATRQALLSDAVNARLKQIRYEGI